jgi:hypothetical protein
VAGSAILDRIARRLDMLANGFDHRSESDVEHR